MKDKSKWENGIPKYKESDLMTKQELHEFGIETVYNYLKNKNYNIVYLNRVLNSFPSIVAEKDEKTYSIVVLSDIAPKMPKIWYECQYLSVEYAKEYHTIPCLARLGFASSDPERFEKSLALKEDGYYVNFPGLELLPMEEPNIGTKDYKARAIYHLGLAYRHLDVLKIETLIDDDCEWYSEFSEKKYFGKEEIIKYYNEKFDNIEKSDSTMDFELCQLKGNFKDMHINKLHVNGEVVENAHVKMLQEDGKLVLLVEQTLRGETNGLLIDVDFSENGLFKKINLYSPYKFKFETYYDEDFKKLED